MTLAFSPCRHRHEPRTRWVYHCRSPKLAGLKLVTPEICRQCPFVDHHWPGESDDPAGQVHPGMPAEELAALLDGPPLPWPPGWGDWEVTTQAHWLAAERFLAGLPTYPDDRFRGQGLVIAGGGAAYFPSLYVTVRAIRHVGCVLPIQVWYLGRNRELPPEHQSLLERFGVECIDADAVRERHPCRILNGWELKVFAALHAPFAEVLSLDADCYPIRDPSVLFADPGYRATGAVFWPDLADSHPIDWPAFGLPSTGRPLIESGQFLIHKRPCWRALQLAWWYNDHSDWSYLHGYGDTHTFEIAWARCGQDYTMYQPNVEWSFHSFKHVGPDGRLLFVHRCRDKFRFGTPDYMTAQTFEANRFHPGLPLETECFTWLRELVSEFRSELAATNPQVRAFMYTCPKRRAVWEATLERWRATDWGEDPIVVMDDRAETGAGPRHQATARRMLALAAEQGAEFNLFLEDDLLFNLYLRHNLLHWPPLRDHWLWMGSLYNPGLALSVMEETTGEWSPFVLATPSGYIGAQAVILSRAAVEASLREWEAVGPSGFDRLLARITQRHSPGIVLHVPSLVQHVPVPSSLDNRYHRAINFDPFYRA